MDPYIELEILLVFIDMQLMREEATQPGTVCEVSYLCALLVAAALRCCSMAAGLDATVGQELLGYCFASNTGPHPLQQATTPSMH